MTDRTEPTLSLEHSLSGGGFDDFIDVAGGIVGDVVSGIPAPVRKSFIKALSQLCTAAMDVPIAHFEGLAIEKRAETKARTLLIAESTKQIAADMSVDERFVQAASQKFAQKVVREQINLNSIVAVAVAELKSDDSPASSENLKPEDPTVTPVIGDDWLNNFEREASTKTSAEMQLLFGKILAGEIRKPSSFSIKTVRLISQLESDAARAFAKFCSMAVSISIDGVVWDARVVAPGADKTMDPFKQYGFPYSSLLLLQESGLLMAEFQTSMDYTSSILIPNRSSSAFRYLNEDTYLMKSGDAPFSGRLLLTGPSLTSSGKELFKIVDLTPNDKYTAALRGYFTVQGFKMMSLKK